MEEALLKINVKRRTFLKGAGLLGASLLLLTLGGCDEIAEAIKNRPIRRRIRTGSAAVDRDIEIYRRAVESMKSLSTSDARNWTRQAELHGNTSGFTFCAHRTPHFPSWHRAYLYHFEKICQKLTGETNFGLPYWNWVIDPRVPSQFLDPSSTLFSTRTNLSMAGNPAVQSSELETILSYDNYTVFNSRLEGTPHNTVHARIGGVLGRANSPLDPLFWLHHCMVDYCWANWNITRGHNNPEDTAWGDQEWGHFFDGDGNPASMQARITTILPLLAYQYEESQIGNPLPPLVLKTNIELKKMKERVEKGAKVEFNIKQILPIANEARLGIGKIYEIKTQLNQGQFNKILDSNSEDRIFASVRFAKLPTTNDFFVKVFVNSANPIIDINKIDLHYAGSFAFFGTSMSSDASTVHSHDEMPEFLVDLTDTVNELRKKSIISEKEPLTLQLLPVPFSDDKTLSNLFLDLARIDIIISPVKLISKK